VARKRRREGRLKPAPTKRKESGGKPTHSKSGVNPAKKETRVAPPVLRVLYTMHPALTRWANLYRASGARAPTRRPGRAALAAEHVSGSANGGVGVLDGRREFADGESIEGAETGVEFGGGQAAVAEEPAEKIVGGTFAFEGIAFEAAGNQVAVGVAPCLCAGHDVIEALGARVGAAQAIETASTFAEVNGLAQGAGLQEVELLEVNRRVDGAGRMRGVTDGESARTCGGNLIGEAHLDDVPGFAAMDDAERANDDQAAHRLAHRAGANANAASQPRHGAVELEVAFQAGVAEEMRIDGAVGEGEAEPRVEKVLELFPNESGVQFFGFHGLILRWR
jgi:hypothetical protein